MIYGCWTWFLKCVFWFLNEWKKKIYWPNLSQTSSHKMKASNESSINKKCLKDETSAEQFLLSSQSIRTENFFRSNESSYDAKKQTMYEISVEAAKRISVHFYSIRNHLNKYRIVVKFLLFVMDFIRNLLKNIAKKDKNRWTMSAPYLKVKIMLSLITAEV